VGGEDDTLAADLSAAWDQAESGDIAEAPEPERELPLRDAAGRFSSRTKPADDFPEDGEVDGDIAEPSAITAPEHWSQANQDAFNALPDEIKPAYMEKVRSLEGGYQQKFEARSRPSNLW
jgi:hypothetical protein